MSAIGKITRRGVLALPLIPAMAKADMLTLDAGSFNRRWVPNVAEIPTLRAWYDATDASKAIFDTSGWFQSLASKITDASFTLTQAAAANRPRVSYYLGKQVINMPANTHWLTGLNAPLPLRHQGVAMVLAWRPLALDPISLCQINRLSAPAQRVDFLGSAGGFAYRYGTFGGDFGQGADRPIAMNWMISTTSGQVDWLNGGDAQPLGAGSLTSSPTADLELGRFTGNVGHWIILSGPGITQAQLNKLEGFVAWDLGIQSVLVVGHPYRTKPP